MYETALSVPIGGLTLHRYAISEQTEIILLRLEQTVQNAPASTAAGTCWLGRLARPPRVRHSYLRNLMAQFTPMDTGVIPEHQALLGATYST